jgi:glycosyltransferase involved in cell wall biosynthesis
MTNGSSVPTVRMLGTRGIPAEHGGFETAAEHLADYLVNRGWRVVVYCQDDAGGSAHEDVWNGIERVHIPVDRAGAAGTAQFDWMAARHASRHPGLCLLFGYNTAVFNVLQRLRQVPLVINMDGIEWQRERWGPSRRVWLYLNERFAGLLGNDLIADHPAIEQYLRGRVPSAKLTMIPYGADEVTECPDDSVRALGLQPGRYLTLICRPVQENSILELVKGFSREERGVKLVVLGAYDVVSNKYHRDVQQAASSEVLFPGAIYDPQVTRALRYHSLAYLHGHTVGGTNPSLVEAMGAGNAIVAHDNRYNRWVASTGALYFSDTDSAAAQLSRVINEPELRRTLSSASRSRHHQLFTWDRVAEQYESLLQRRLELSKRTRSLGRREVSAP